MTASCPGFSLVPHDLSRAPELASLALVEEALHVSILSLCAEHPTLQNEPDPSDPASIRRARRLVAAVATFRAALSRYRGAVHRSLCPPPSPQHDPLF
jgi:hypothetical protein